MKSLCILVTVSFCISVHQTHTTLFDRESQRLVLQLCGHSAPVHDSAIYTFRHHPGQPLLLLSLQLLGFTVGTMCNYKRQVTVVDLTTSFLTLSTSKTHTNPHIVCKNSLSLFLSVAGNRKNLQPKE